MSEEIHERIAAQLYEAEKNNAPVGLLSREYPVFTTADAYAVQQEGLKLRLADGAQVVGRKIGITSEGMMKMLKCSSPDYGYLLESGRLVEGGSCDCANLNLPIVEGELAFILGRDLDGAPVTEQDVIAATDHIVPCFEVCDTRFESWDVTVRDTICDNAAVARFMLGSSSRTLDDIDPSLVGMTMEKNGEVISNATGAEVMGSPINSVMWLANKLLEYGDHLAAGDIVLSGAFAAADRAHPGDSYTVTVRGFFPLSIQFS
ncbi:MAG: fumarylacetoacetate hydrolase family protein [Eggerthellaceae bacterium]|nr:fumarylacetoacetate hydrolase family protein [Eggerthellaceae bacterium]